MAATETHPLVGFAVKRPQGVRARLLAKPQHRVDHRVGFALLRGTDVIVLREHALQQVKLDCTDADSAIRYVLARNGGDGSATSIEQAVQRTAACMVGDELHGMLNLPFDVLLPQRPPPRSQFADLLGPEAEAEFSRSSIKALNQLHRLVSWSRLTRWGA